MSEDKPIFKLKSIQEVGMIIQIEGLEYSITDYLSPHQIEDEVLRKLWAEARESINKVDLYLENILGDNYKYE